MKQLVILLSFLVFGFSAIEPLFAGDISLEKKSASAKATVSGKKFFLNSNNLNKAFSNEMSTKLISNLKKFLVSNGYEQVKKEIDAHLVITISSGVSDQLGSFFNNSSKMNIQTKSTTQVIKYVDGKLEANKKLLNGFKDFKKAYLSINNNIQKYGSRPVNMSAIVVRPPEDTWMNYETEALKVLAENYATLFPKAPKTEVKMAGKPGCSPMFGFLCDYSGKIQKVVKGSAAEKAGLRAGDIMIGVDSTFSCGKNNIDPDVYNKMMTVPLKYKRGEKVVRSTIKPIISCL